MKSILSVLLVVAIIATMSTATALGYTAGTLPGGTSIEVDNTQPTDGEVFYIPVGEISIDITYEGTASVGEGVAIADTTLIYVIDASGSTRSVVSGATCGEQQTHEPVSTANQTIDCEILAAINLNDQAISLGSIDEVAMVIFGGANVTADATPGGGYDIIIDPAADANDNTINDVNEVLKSIKVQPSSPGFGLFTNNSSGDGWTNFGAGIEAALDIAALATNSNVIVAFLSDGNNTRGSHVDTFDYSNVVFHTFAIGSLASLIADPYNLGSLQDIADNSNGTATRVEDPSDLPDILPELIVATLVSLEIEVDGGGATPIDNTDIDPDLPQDGPITVNYSITLYDLGPGEHEVSVTANGTDVGGSGSVTDYNTITVVQSFGLEFKITDAKLDFKNQPDDDRVRIQGNLALDLDLSDGVDISEPVTVIIGPLTEIITMVEKGNKGDRWEYKRSEDGTGDIQHMTIDWKTGRFEVRLDGGSLTGVTNPVIISIQIENDYGEATILMVEKKQHWDYKD